MHIMSQYMTNGTKINWSKSNIQKNQLLDRNSYNQSSTTCNYKIKNKTG